MRRRHAAWCVVLAERASAELNSSESDAWLARLAADHDNLRAAMEWAVECEEPETGLRLGARCGRSGSPAGTSARRERLRRALATIGSENVALGIRAGALTGLASLAVYQGDFAQVGAPLDEALALWRRLGDRAGEAHLLHMLAALAEYRGDDEQATSRYEAALALYRELGATREVGSMLENLADAAFRRGELTRSEALASEALAIGRASTDAKMLTVTLVGAAQIASARESMPLRQDCWRKVLRERTRPAIGSDGPTRWAVAPPLPWLRDRRRQQRSSWPQPWPSARKSACRGCSTRRSTGARWRQFRCDSMRRSSPWRGPLGASSPTRRFGSQPKKRCSSQEPWRRPASPRVLPSDLA